MGKVRKLFCELCGDSFEVDVCITDVLDHLDSVHKIDIDIMSFVMLFKVVDEVDVDE